MSNGVVGEGSKSAGDGPRLAWFDGTAVYLTSSESGMWKERICNALVTYARLLPGEWEYGRCSVIGRGAIWLERSPLAGFRWEVWREKPSPSTEGAPPTRPWIEWSSWSPAWVLAQIEQAIARARGDRFGKWAGQMAERDVSFRSEGSRWPLLWKVAAIAAAIYGGVL